MSENQLSYSAGELQHLSVKCPRCGTKTTFDMRMPVDVADNCATCGNNLDGLRRLLNDYREFCKGAVRGSYEVRIEVEEPRYARTPLATDPDSKA
jgi:endogenous inhibitor of DNA gyrase (YacG/DUF329 family)